MDTEGRESRLQDTGLLPSPTSTGHLSDGPERGTSPTEVGPQVGPIGPQEATPVRGSLRLGPPVQDGLLVLVPPPPRRVPVDTVVLAGAARHGGPRVVAPARRPQPAALDADEAPQPVLLVVAPALQDAREVVPVRRCALLGAGRSVLEARHATAEGGVREDVRGAVPLPADTVPEREAGGGVAVVTGVHVVPVPGSPSGPGTLPVHVVGHSLPTTPPRTGHGSPSTGVYG